MQQLETTKGKNVIVPRMVTRYGIVFYKKYDGWQSYFQLYTTPESAIEQFLKSWSGTTPSDFTPSFYKVFELELEIPFVPKDVDSSLSSLG